ncbi:MAG: hypothetical protein Q7S00_07065, partial [bacterium]|nr:hypothetical protein [bacterium]
ELDLISPSEAAALPDEVLKSTQKKGDLPKPYSPNFVSLLQSVLKKGHLSTKKASELLDITEEGLKSVLRS